MMHLTTADLTLSFQIQAAFVYRQFGQFHCYSKCCGLFLLHAPYTELSDKCE